MNRKILICGLPGAGKTTLAKALAPRLNAVHFNADDVRANINKYLGFTVEDRIEQARRMGWLCDRVVEAGGFAIADFVCPTPDTRDAFGVAFVVWLDRIQKSRFPDTDKIFVHPEYDLHVTADWSPEYWADQIVARVRPTFDWKKPTALFIGRYQPFHTGHRALIVEGLAKSEQVCVAVRDTEGTDKKNPFGFERVRMDIEHSLREFEGRFIVIPVPNISHVLYGRDVGYKVERIDLDAATEAISATDIRARLRA